MGRRKLISSDYETSEEEAEQEEETNEEDSDETVPGTEGEDEDDGFCDMFYLDIPRPSNYAPKGRHPLESVKDGDVMPTRERRASDQHALDLPMLTQKLEAFAAARVDNDSDTDEEVIPCSTPIAFKKRAAIPITTRKRKASEVAIDSDVDAGGPRSDDEDAPAASAPSRPAAASPPEPRERRRRLARDQDEGEGEDVGPQWTFECVLVEMDVDDQEEANATELPAVTQVERAEFSATHKTRRPEPSQSACTAAVAIKTGWSLGPPFKTSILDIPGKPTFAELKEKAAENRIVADAILEKYFETFEDWKDRTIPVKFGGWLGGDRYTSISHGDNVYKVGDHVFVKCARSDYECALAGAPGLGWIATLVEIRRDTRDELSSSFPGSCLLRWFEGAKTEHCLGAYGHDRELFLTDGEPDSNALTVIRGHASVSFSEGPTEGADFFCRAMVSFEYDEDGNVLPEAVSFIRRKHAQAEALAPIQASHELKILDLFSGSGLGGYALEQAGAGKVAWSFEIDPVPATTNAFNSDTKVFNVDANDALRGLAAAQGAGSELAFLADNGLADRLGERAAAMGYPGSYKVSELPRPRKVGILLDTSPCPAHSKINTCKDDEDPRHRLLATSLSFAELLLPDYVLSENVMGMLETELEPPTARDRVGQPHQLQAAVLLDLRYSVRRDTMMAVRYGSSQVRERTTTIASFEDCPLWTHPEATHAISSDSDEVKACLPMAPTIRDVISDLRAFDLVDEPETRPLNHLERYRTRPQNKEQSRLQGDSTEVTLHVTMRYGDDVRNMITHVPLTPGANYHNIPLAVRGPATRKISKAYYHRLDEGDYFRTVTCAPHPASVNGKIMRPDVSPQRRPFSLREFARAQGFPDGWILEGTRSQIMRQIGNALEYHIAYALGAALVQAIEGVDK